MSGLPGFESLGEVSGDDRGRIALTRAGVKPGDLFALYVKEDGQILLVPHVSIPLAEYKRLKKAAGE